MKDAVGLELTELYAPEIPKRPREKSNFSLQRKRALGKNQSVKINVSATSIPDETVKS
jgi:hypothetical protein